MFLPNSLLLYPNFVSDLQNINPDLKRSELMFCAMLKLNFSSKEIANITQKLLHTSLYRKGKIKSERDLIFPILG